MDDQTSDVGTVLDPQTWPVQGASPGFARGAKADAPPLHIVISLHGVRKSYHSASGEVAEVLKGLDLEVEAGSFNVIRGESGSGKTSLLRILGMLDSKFEGEYLFADVNVNVQPDWYRDELRSN